MNVTYINTFLTPFNAGDQTCGDRALKAIFRRLCGQSRTGTCAEVERVMLSDGCRLSDRGLQLVSRRCPELTHLQLQNCAALSNTALFDSVTKCSNLQHLDITGECNRTTSRDRRIEHVCTPSLCRLHPGDDHQFRWRLRSATSPPAAVPRPDRLCGHRRRRPANDCAQLSATVVPLSAAVSAYYR